MFSLPFPKCLCCLSTLSLITRDLRRNNTHALRILSSLLLTSPLDCRHAARDMATWRQPSDCPAWRVPLWTLPWMLLLRWPLCGISGCVARTKMISKQVVDRTHKTYLLTGRLRQLLCRSRRFRRNDSDSDCDVSAWSFKVVCRELRILGRSGLTLNIANESGFSGLALCFHSTSSNANKSATCAIDAN